MKGKTTFNLNIEFESEKKRKLHLHCPQFLNFEKNCKVLIFKEDFFFWKLYTRKIIYINGDLKYVWYKKVVSIDDLMKKNYM